MGFKINLVLGTQPGRPALRSAGHTITHSSQQTSRTDSAAINVLVEFWILFGDIKRSQRWKAFGSFLNESCPHVTGNVNTQAIINSKEAKSSPFLAPFCQNSLKMNYQGFLIISTNSISGLIKTLDLNEASINICPSEEPGFKETLFEHHAYIFSPYDRNVRSCTSPSSRYFRWLRQVP